MDNTGSSFVVCKKLEVVLNKKNVLAEICAVVGLISEYNQLEVEEVQDKTN